MDMWVEPESGNRQEAYAFVSVRSLRYVNQVVTPTMAYESTMEHFDAFSQLEQSRVPCAMASLVWKGETTI